MSKRKTTEEFKKEVYNLVQDEYEVLEEYINCQTKILMKHNCKDCNNYKWKIQPNSFLQGVRCPQCAKNSRIINNKNISTKKKTQKDFCSRNL